MAIKQDNLCKPATPTPVKFKNWRILLEQSFNGTAGLQALADGNQRIRIRQKTLEFSSTVLPAPSSYHICLQKLYKRTSQEIQLLTEQGTKALEQVIRNALVVCRRSMVHGPAAG